MCNLLKNLINLHHYQRLENMINEFFHKKPAFEVNQSWHI